MRFIASESIATEANVIYERHRDIVRSLIPTARVEHIGATAIPTALTKGDVDLLVVVDPKVFAEAEAVLAQRYERNEGSERSATFAAFIDPEGAIPVGLQLVADGSPDEVAFRAAQTRLKEPSTLARYNRLKERFRGKSPDKYLEAKASFIAELLETDASQD
ncbi:MAG TPA: GrpB family protein [Candidatus Eremiobacteraceae bacterium]|nr:GrpB family protein [Candidatus Eremiobacteraceae bacterium]